MKDMECKVADIEQLAEAFLSNAMNGRMSVAVLPYKETVELIAELLKEKDVSVKTINVSDEDIDNYNKEYTISIDDELWLFAEPAWGSVERGYSRDGYLEFGGDYVFISKDSYDNVRPYCKSEIATYKLMLESDKQEDVEIEECVGEITQDSELSVICNDGAKIFNELLGAFFNNRF